MTSSTPSSRCRRRPPLKGSSRVTGTFDEFASTHGIPDAARRAVQIVLDELLSNTARCGKVDGREPMVDVGFRIDGGDSPGRDRGRRGVPSIRSGGRSPDTTLPIEERPIGGLGVMLVTRLVDGIRYEREGSRNRVRFGKRLDP